MDLLVRADDLFLQNKYKEAYLSYKKMMECEDLSNDEYEYCLQRIIKICSLLNWSNERAEQSLSLAKLNIEKNNFNRALKELSFIDKDISLEQTSVYLQLSYLASVKSGQLLMAQKFSNRYIQFHLIKKNIPKIEEHLADRKNTGIFDDAARRFEFEVKLLKGDYEWFEQFESDIIEEYRNNKKMILSLMSEFYDSVSRSKHWRRSPAWLWFKAITNLEKIKLNNALIHTRKEFAHAIYDLLLLNPRNNILHELIIDYAITVKRPNLAKSSITSLESNGKVVDDFIIEGLDSLGLDPTENLDTDLDMGTDLFRDVGNTQDKVKVLESKIDFIRSSGNKEKLSELLEELRDLDQNHTLVKEVFEKEQKVTGSRVLSGSGHVSDTGEIEDSLLLEISQFLPETSDVNIDEVETNERALKKVVSMMPFSELLANAIDLIAAFNTLGMPGVSLLILEYLSNTSDNETDVKEVLNIKYLLIETYIESERLYKALNIAEEVCEKYPLIDSERICFYYLRAEILRRLGNVREALRFYVFVAKLDKNYRLVKQRLKEFE